MQTALCMNFYFIYVHWNIPTRLFCSKTVNKPSFKGNTICILISWELYLHRFVNMYFNVYILIKIKYIYIYLHVCSTLLLYSSEWLQIYFLSWHEEDYMLSMLQTIWIVRVFYKISKHYVNANFFFDKVKIIYYMLYYIQILI
jgi:hypothetical protein